MKSVVNHKQKESAELQEEVNEYERRMAAKVAEVKQMKE